MAHRGGLSPAFVAMMLNRNLKKPQANSVPAPSDASERDFTPLEEILGPASVERPRVAASDNLGQQARPSPMPVAPSRTPPIAAVGVVPGSLGIDGRAGNPTVIPANVNFTPTPLEEILGSAPANRPRGVVPSPHINPSPAHAIALAGFRASGLGFDRRADEVTDWSTSSHPLSTSQPRLLNRLASVEMGSTARNVPANDGWTLPKLHYADGAASVVPLENSGGLRTPVSSIVRNGQIHITPEWKSINKDVREIIIPNNVGARGFVTNHGYAVTSWFPETLTGADGLRRVGQALVNNPTSDKRAATPAGALNDVGRLEPLDRGDNYVRSFVVPSPDRARMTDVVVNYTVKGKHTADEGAVIRFGVLMPSGRIRLVTYGEGDSWKQSPRLERLWKGFTERYWGNNARKIYRDSRDIIE